MLAQVHFNPTYLGTKDPWELFLFNFWDIQYFLQGKVIYVYIHLLASLLINFSKYFVSTLSLWRHVFPNRKVYIRCLLNTYFLITTFFSWPCCTACRLLVPRPGIEPRPSAVKVQSPKLCTREFPKGPLFICEKEGIDSY